MIEKDLYTGYPFIANLIDSITGMIAESMSRVNLIVVCEHTEGLRREIVLIGKKNGKQI